MFLTVRPDRRGTGIGKALQVYTEAMVSPPPSRHHRMILALTCWLEKARELGVPLRFLSLPGPIVSLNNIRILLPSGAKQLHLSRRRCIAPTGTPWRSGRNSTVHRCFALKSIHDQTEPNGHE